MVDAAGEADIVGLAEKEVGIVGFVVQEADKPGVALEETGAVATGAAPGPGGCSKLGHRGCSKCF